jgi:AIR synthase-related protein
MKLEPGQLSSLAAELAARVELRYKTDIALAARAFGRESQSAWFPSPSPIANGDDAAALPDGDGYLLFAAEGMRAEFVAADPWFAGFCSVMVNLSDIAAMGGRPWAITNVMFLGEGENERVFEGMVAASEAYGVPVVGGHTSRVNGPSQLAVSVVGRARRLISSQAARPGQVLMMAIDLRGTFRGAGGNFNAATSKSARELRALLALLPELAESGLVAAGKDISMAGLCGSLLMLCETSGVGATLDVARVPAPANVEVVRWLSAFPSYGFVLAVEPEAVSAVSARFDALGVRAVAIGSIEAEPRLELWHGDERAVYFDLREQALTSFGNAQRAPT